MFEYNVLHTSRLYCTGILRSHSPPVRLVVVDMARAKALLFDAVRQKSVATMQADLRFVTLLMSISYVYICCSVPFLRCVYSFETAQDRFQEISLRYCEHRAAVACGHHFVRVYLVPCSGVEESIVCVHSDIDITFTTGK